MQIPLQNQPPYNNYRIGYVREDKYERRDQEYYRNRMVEEAGEVLQLLGKIGRFGYFSRNPQTSETNLNLLKQEFDQLVVNYMKLLETLNENNE
jgi:NTP pyrophosphatase (non-canonical NTP hydrolase)